MMGKKLDLTGQRFGRLVAVKDTGKRKAGQVVWLCQCDCGKIKEICCSPLRNGNTRSCGCYCRDIAKKTGKLNATHGATRGRRRIRIYRIWMGIKGRCYNKNNQDYFNYGKRGIKVSEAWKKSFVVFRNWALSHGYKEHLTINRKDVNGNYRPENCEWISNSENTKRMMEYHSYDNFRYFLRGIKVGMAMAKNKKMGN